MRRGLNAIIRGLSARLGTGRRPTSDRPDSAAGAGADLEAVDVSVLRAELLRRDPPTTMKVERTPVSAFPREISHSLRSAVRRGARHLATAVVLGWRELVPASARYATRLCRAGLAAVRRSGRQVRGAATAGSDLASAWFATRSAEAPPVAAEPLVTPALPSAEPELSSHANSELLGARARLSAVEAAFGYEHPRVAAELHLMGAIHHDARRYAEAVAFYAAALGIRERTLGPAHPEVAATLEDMAVARFEEGEEGEAARLLALVEAFRQAPEESSDSLAGADA